MAKASQAVILENEFYIIKAPNGKVLEVKNFNTENGAAIQLWIVGADRIVLLLSHLGIPYPVE